MRIFQAFLATAAFAIMGRTGQPSSLEYDNPPTQQLDTRAGLHPPIPLLTPEAHYSPEARKRVINGKCLVSLVVGLDGKAHNVDIVRCSDQTFAQGSIDAVSQYTFTPATTATGTPVPVTLNVRVDYKIGGGKKFLDPVRVNVRLENSDTTRAIAKVASAAANAESKPAISKFVDKGFGDEAFQIPGNAPCEIAITVNAKGKTSDATASHCKPESLITSAIHSLLASKFTPATAKGKAIPVRAMVELEYDDFSAKP